MLWIILLLYVVPLVVNYFTTRRKIIKYNLQPDLIDVIAVLVPFFNFIWFTFFIFEEIGKQNILNLFFGVNRRDK